MPPIFQIIHNRNKPLNPQVKGGLERRRKVQTRLQGPFTSSLYRQRKKPQIRGCIRSELDESWDNARASIVSVLLYDNCKEFF